MIDAHAHLTHSADEDPEGLLERAQHAKLQAIINVCTDEEDLKRGLALFEKQQNPRVYVAAALTPHDAARDDALFYKAIEAAASTGKLVAIGEFGLDYHYDLAPKDVQINVVKRYLELARKVELPVVIHCREAFADLFELLSATREVMLHCFTGSLEEAQEAVARGWYVSLSGIVTFPKSVALQEVAKWLPLDKMLIETDSPYLAPQGYRGKINEPAFLEATAKYIAALRGISVEELIKATADNAKRLFHGIS